MRTGQKQERRRNERNEIKDLPHNLASPRRANSARCFSRRGLRARVGRFGGTLCGDAITTPAAPPSSPRPARWVAAQPELSLSRGSMRRCHRPRRRHSLPPVSRPPVPLLPAIARGDDSRPHAPWSAAVRQQAVAPMQHEPRTDLGDQRQRYCAASSLRTEHHLREHRPSPHQL